MALEVIWAPRTETDLKDIWEFISKDSPKYADLVVKEIMDLGESLAELPLSGKSLEEFPKEKFRMRLIHNFRLIYRVKRRSVEIMAVSHSARILKI